MIKKINEWSNVADIRWLTTWDKSAQTHLAPALELLNFELGRIPEEKMSKVEAAILAGKKIGPDGLVIWIDDELKAWKERNEEFLMDPEKVYVRQQKNVKKEFSIVQIQCCYHQHWD